MHTRVQARPFTALVCIAVTFKITSQASHFAFGLCNLSWLFPQCGNYSNPACRTELILAVICTHMKSL